MIIESNSLCAISGKRSLIFYTEELSFVPASRSFHLSDRNEDATTLYKQKGGKTGPLIGLKQFVLPRQTVATKAASKTTSFPGSRGCFQKNFKHQPVGDILFFPLNPSSHNLLSTSLFSARDVLGRNKNGTSRNHEMLYYNLLERRGIHI